MKISVIIPLFNKKDTIQRAVESVLNQTYKPLEIIIINDGSTDGSGDVAREIQDEMVRVYDQTNKGVSVARNNGISIAKGDWIAFLDADDEWLPWYLEKLSQLAAKYPDCSVAATAYFLSDIHGHKRAPILRKLPFIGSDGILDNYFVVAASSEPPLWTSAIAVRKNVIEEICFPQDITSGEDLITWAKLAMDNKISYSTIPSSVFNQASAHTYTDKPNRVPQIPDIVGSEFLKLYTKNKSMPGLKNYLSHWHKMRTSIFLRLGLRRLAAVEGLKSLYFCPWNIRVYSYFILLVLPECIVKKVFLKWAR